MPDKELEEKPSIQTILLSFSDPINGNAGHHNVVFAEKQILAILSTSQREAEIKGRYEGQAEMYNDLWNITQLYPDPAKGTIAIIKAIADYKDKITNLTDSKGV